MARRLRLLAAVPAAALLALAACAGPVTTTYPGGAPVGPGDRLYVSIGDSYAAGYQPVPGGAGGTSTNGFAYQVANRSAGLGRPPELVNFGCSGVTSVPVMDEPGCQAGARAPGGAPYTDAQGQAAVRFVAQHRAQVALVTVVLGGNDVEPCLLTPEGRIRGDSSACVTQAVAALGDNLRTLLDDLRAAAGPAVTIVGLTYPDVYLGAWVSRSPDARAIATGSVVLFRSILNPALEQAYRSAGATFADITSVTGAYGPLDVTADQPPYGTIPQPVARICTLTYYCELGDVHPRTYGYGLIADQVLRAWPAP